MTRCYYLYRFHEGMYLLGLISLPCFLFPVRACLILSSIAYNLFDPALEEPLPGEGEAGAEEVNAEEPELEL